MLGIYILIWRVILLYLYFYCGFNLFLGVDKGGIKIVYEKIEEKLEVCLRRIIFDKYVDVIIY